MHRGEAMILITGATSTKGVELNNWGAPSLHSATVHFAAIKAETFLTSTVTAALQDLVNSEER